MFKIKRTLPILLSFATMFALNGCAPSELQKPDSAPPTPTFTPHESAAGIPDRLTSENEKTVRFKDGASSDFYWANGYSNGGNFNCTWRKSCATVSDGVMSMSVVKEGNSYGGAEYRTDKLYSYGFYSVRMKAAKGSGIISSYFTYTNKPVWDEIDIEFLGKDTTKIQFNYFTKGSDKGHTFLFDLGYDAAESFHEYAFEWKKDCIVWYVDGTAVYRATENLPTNPMQLMLNVWNVRGADEWSGVFDESALPATAQYEWFAFVPEN